MGAIFQTIADRIGDTSTLLLAVLFFGAVAALVALAITGVAQILQQLRAASSFTWVLAATIGAVGVYIGWQDLMRRPSGAARSQSGPSGIPVHTARVEKKPFPVVLNGLGTVQPLNIVTVRSRVDGQIEKIAFEEGQMVRERDPLV